MATSIKFNSPVILSFSLLCTVVYALSLATNGGALHLFSVGTTIDWSNPLSIFSLFSHVLGHIDAEHLLGNLSFILLIGPIIEEKYGSSATMMMILATSLITGILNVMFFSSGLMGASGIVFMLILLVSFTNVRSGEIPITFILVTMLFVGKEVLQALKVDQVSQFAHIIGGVCGSMFGFGTYRVRR